MLWSLVVDSLLMLFNRYVRAFGYANDISILARSMHERVLPDLVQTALKKSAGRCKKKDLNIEADKVATVVFIRNLVDMIMGDKQVKLPKRSNIWE